MTNKAYNLFSSEIKKTLSSVLTKPGELSENSVFSV